MIERIELAGAIAALTLAASGLILVLTAAGVIR